ncbi:hypothetical protein FSARC_7802 [Fusarium sarcochroum]|uniref:Uncharacterized protein n=1 Tax=Fusarium sarcochroum TaxID=1208366 RepID=A0A8H4X701_9HYPO|nr:hypothetical protein FSARC_7802 [Fusarium sarcochroum]
MHRSPLADHLLEVIALLDIPCFTLNRISQSLDIWKLHVGPNKESGIEQTSGLPYTLITLLANLDSSDVESELLQWHGDIADEFMQIHLWEAFKCAGILHSRALVGHDQDPSTSSTTRVKTEVVRMKVFAAIQAIIGSGTFNFRQPLAKAILYPLFIAGLLAENSQEQRLTRVAFQYLMENGQERTEQVALDIITKVWNNGRDGDEVSKLMMATGAAAELNVELHLY